MSFVSECPIPPAYYKEFVDGHNIKPPPIPTSFDAHKSPYGGTFDELQKMKINLPLNDDEKDLTGSEVRTRLKALLKQVVLDALSPLTANEKKSDLNTCKIKIDNDDDDDDTNTITTDTTATNTHSSYNTHNHYHYYR